MLKHGVLTRVQLSRILRMLGEKRRSASYCFKKQEHFWTTECGFVWVFVVVFFWPFDAASGILGLLS